MNSAKPWDKGRLIVSDNKRFLQFENGEPFFWLGDTGWLLFSRLNKEEAERYLEDRKEKGFNVIQVMVIHSIDIENTYGNPALIDKDITAPCISSTSSQEGYWEHVDYIVEKAAEKGLYLALVPVWGSVVENGYLDREKAETYGSWIGKRYRDCPNIIWLNGGDTKGNENREIWERLGSSIKQEDSSHLMTFHPFGRRQSSEWFHESSWLDFNMFQSGHRRYDQGPGEDNWQFVQNDYKKRPIKPTIDGEPSYEGIPQGLHDPSEPYWQAKDVRRYAYWSVFAGAFGHTYGHSAIMQMHKTDYDGEGAYGVKKYWYEALDAEGATQMKYLKKLLLSRDLFTRVPAQSVIAGDEGKRYDRILVTRGQDYLYAYTYTGREINIQMGYINGEEVKAAWYNPRTGKITSIGHYKNDGVQGFKPPAGIKEGNDWVLILDSIARNEE